MSKGPSEDVCRLPFIVYQIRTCPCSPCTHVLVPGTVQDQPEHIQKYHHVLHNYSFIFCESSVCTPEDFQKTGNGNDKMQTCMFPLIVFSSSNLLRARVSSRFNCSASPQQNYCQNLIDSHKNETWWPLNLSTSLVSFIFSRVRARVLRASNGSTCSDTLGLTVSQQLQQIMLNQVWSKFYRCLDLIVSQAQQFRQPHLQRQEQSKAVLRGTKGKG